MRVISKMFINILAFYFLRVCFVSASSGYSETTFHSCLQRKLTIDIFATVTANSLIHCAILCSENGDCVSANYRQDSETDNCNLSTFIDDGGGCTSQPLYPSAIVLQPRKNCLSGGVLNADNICLCPSGFFGHLCQNTAKTPEIDTSETTEIPATTPEIDTTGTTEIPATTPDIDTTGTTEIPATTSEIDSTENTEIPATTPEIDTTRTTEIPATTPDIDTTGTTEIPATTSEIDSTENTEIPATTPEIDTTGTTEIPATTPDKDTTETTEIPATTSEIDTTGTTGCPTSGSNLSCSTVGYTYDPLSGVCYRIVDTGAEVTWDEAKANCEAVTGGHLLSYLDESLRERLAAEILASPVFSTAIRIHIDGRGSATNVWVSWDGQPLIYSVWAPNQPNSGIGSSMCIMMAGQQQYRLNDLQCDWTGYHICQTPVC